MQIVLKIENFGPFKLVKTPDLPGFPARSGKDLELVKEGLQDAIESHLHRLLRLGTAPRPFRSVEKIKQEEAWGYTGNAVWFETLEVDVPCPKPEGCQTAGGKWQQD